MDDVHGHNKVTGRYITVMLFLVVLTPTIWSSKLQTNVKISKFGAKFTALKEAVKGSVMLHYHLIFISIRICKPTPIFVDNLIVVLNFTNPGITLKNNLLSLATIFLGIIFLTMLWR